MSKKRHGHKHKPKVPVSKRRSGLNGSGGSASAKHKGNGVKSERHANVEEPTPIHQARGRGDSGMLLLNENQVQSDTRLINRAVRGRWGVRRTGMIRRRLEGIVEKESVTVASRVGPIDVDYPADVNAVAAARVLVQMNGQDQADDHFAIKAKLPQAQPGVSIGNVNVNLDPRQSAILQLAQRLGATELICDNTTIPVTQSAGESLQAGTVQQVASESVVRESTLAKARKILEP